MLLTAEVSHKSVQLGFVMIYGYVKVSNASNLQDVNIFLENSFCKVLNKLYQCNLVNLNSYDDKNFPGVDLGDESTKIAVQITSTETREKIVKTITKFEEHKLFNKFNHLRVLLIDVRKPKYRDAFATNGKYTFDKDKDILVLNDLYLELVKQGDEAMEAMKTILEAELQPLSTFFKENNQNIETVVFQDLFKAVSQDFSGEALEAGEMEEDNSDLNVKKQRFENYWAFIKETYKEIFDSKREAIYELVQSSFSEVSQIRVREYLKLESRKALLSANDEPVKAIEQLTKSMTEKFQLNFMPETEIQYFLYYQLYQCYVFPNPSTN